VLERHPIKKLHGDERFAVLIVNFVDGADVGVIQRRGSFRFALKAAKGLWVFGYFTWQELEGNKPAELEILSLVHHAHAATTEFPVGAVVRDDLVDHKRCLAGRLILRRQHMTVNINGSETNVSN
jgi:hypothetical protein